MQRPAIAMCSNARLDFDAGGLCVIIASSAVSLKLWWRLANEDRTFLRVLEDQCIEELELHGATLDIGGGQGFGYIDCLRRHGRLDSINIAAELHPTFVADLNAPLPIHDDAYDNAICFNTLEHVFDERLILAELLRVLRPGGRFVITVPFFFKRHGKYGDFHRHTAEYWERMLCQSGLKTDDFRIQPLLWSPLSSALATLPWFRGGLRGRLAKLVVLSFELLRRRGTRPLDHVDHAMGFFIEGAKPAAAPIFREAPLRGVVR